MTPIGRLIVFLDSFHGPHAKRNAIARFLADRTSILGIGMLPLIILTGGRQPLGRLSGMSFNDAMLYHRWLARFAWLQINLHGWTWVAKDALAGTLWKHFTKAWWNWGCLATGCFWALTILSMRELRERSYEVSRRLGFTCCLLSRRFPHRRIPP